MKSIKRTNIMLDTKLAKKGMRLTGLRTYRKLVDFALRELIRRKEIAKEILKLEGKIEWEGDLNEMRKMRTF